MPSLILVVMFDFQTWRIPSRTDRVSPRSVMDVVIQKAENPSQQSTQVKKKRKVSGVSCTVYKPFEEQIASLNLPSTLSPLFEELDPKPGFLRIAQTKRKTFLWLRQSMGWFHGGLSSPISSNKQVKETLETLHMHCQILTSQIWGTSTLSQLRKSCCTLRVHPRQDQVGAAQAVSPISMKLGQFLGFHPKLLQYKFKEIWSKPGGVDHPNVFFLTKMTKTYLKNALKYKILLL